MGCSWSKRLSHLNTLARGSSSRELKVALVPRAKNPRSSADMTVSLSSRFYPCFALVPRAGNPRSNFHVRTDATVMFFRLSLLVSLTYSFAGAFSVIMNATFSSFFLSLFSSSILCCCFCGSQAPSTLCRHSASRFRSYSDWSYMKIHNKIHEVRRSPHTAICPSAWQCCVAHTKTAGRSTGKLACCCGAVRRLSVKRRASVKKS